MKNKFKSYAFCLGVCAAVVGVVVAIGNAFNFKVNDIALTSVLTAILGVFVSLGIVEKEPQNDLDLNLNETTKENETSSNKEEE